MKRRRIKKGPIIILVLVVVVVSLGLFLGVTNFVPKNNKSKVKSNNTTTTKKVSKEKTKDNYDLREGEELISKTTTGMHLTKYQGAYYVDGILIVNKSYPLDSTYEPKEPYKEITSD